MINQPKAPCKDCGDRQLMCHSKCDKYLRYLEENEKYKKQRREIAKRTQLRRKGKR